VVFSLRVDDLIRRSQIWLPGMAVRGALTRLLDALQAYRGEHRMVAWVLAASVGVQALRVAQAWLLGRGLGLDVPVVALNQPRRD
jgi:hypothetical protein